MVKKIIALQVLVFIVACILSYGCSFHIYNPESPLSQESEIIYKVRVKKGDTIAKIAKAFQTKPEAIYDMNVEQDLSMLNAGDTILVRPGIDFIRRYDLGVNSEEFSVRSSLKRNSLLNWPAQGWVSSGYGMRRGRFHQGIDIAAPINTPILTVAEGVITFSGWKRGYGNTVVVTHNGFKTLYAHCNKLLVKNGQKVKAGDKIATVGRTGNARGAHLHFEVRKMNNVAEDPIAYLPHTEEMISWIYRVSSNWAN